jgi:hypothetical protein
MGKLATPDWIKEGFDSPADWEKAHGKSKKKKTVGPSQVRSGLSKSQTKGKTFKIRKCPKCGGNKVHVVLSNESDEEGSEEDEPLTISSVNSQNKGTGEWECKKCGWHGKNIEEEELTEDEFMKYLDEQGEEVA